TEFSKYDTVIIGFPFGYLLPIVFSDNFSPKLIVRRDDFSAFEIFFCQYFYALKCMGFADVFLAFVLIVHGVLLFYVELFF
ncbi:hypothetical protein DK299_15610, partial [Listeria monocytogenes]